MASLHPHIAKGIRSGQEIEFDQWKVADGNRFVGYLPKKVGSRILFIVNIPESDKKRIEDEVLSLTGWDQMDASTMVANVPDDFKLQSEDDEDYDDFDS